MKTIRIVSAICFLFLTLNSVILTQTITMLGSFGPGPSVAWDVSDNGQFVTGYSDSSGYTRAFIWNPNWGMRSLGTLSGFSKAYAISGDGSRIVGESNSVTYFSHAFLWENDTMKDLGTLEGQISRAYDISGNGKCIVGVSTYLDQRTRAFLWKDGAMIDLGILGTDPKARSHATGISYDGTIITGWSDVYGYASYYPVYWDSLGIHVVEALSNNECAAVANKISGNNKVIIGKSYGSPAPEHAFRWTSETGAQDLGTLVGSDGRSEALGITWNGDTVVGWSTGPGQMALAFRWTTAGGMENLNTTFADVLQYKITLSSANAITPDGRYIVGEAYNKYTSRYEAFILDTQGEANGVTDLSLSKTPKLETFPNPFSQFVTIRWQTIEPGWHKLKIYDLHGREIAILFDNFIAPGIHSLTLNRDQIFQDRCANIRITRGVYVCQLITPHGTINRKLLVSE